MIQASARRAALRDEISLVVGDVRYAERYYPPGLRDRILGPYSTDRVGVSRYYLLATPPVVVDFEPSPLDGPMFVEQKRAWCHERGIIYVPVFLRERLSLEQFRARYEDERASMTRGKQEADERAVMAVAAEPDTALATYIEAEVLARLEDELRSGARVRGAAARQRRMKTIAEEIREEMRRGVHAQLGRHSSYREPAAAAR